MRFKAKEKILSKKNRIRLFADVDLPVGGQIELSAAQSHYLLNVMRRQTGDEIFVFNGRDGEFECVLDQCAKKSCLLKVIRKKYDFEKSPDIWLLFAPLKKENTDFVLEKAVELGASRILPVVSEFTVHSALKTERCNAQIIQAAEQCRRQDVPLFESPKPLFNVLENWPKDRKLIYLNETEDKSTFLSQKENLKAPAALLIGPEGGFSQKELEKLKKMPYTCSVSLGKRILRAETAVVASLACWQLLCGDGNGEG